MCLESETGLDIRRSFLANNQKKLIRQRVFLKRKTGNSITNKNKSTWTTSFTVYCCRNQKAPFKALCFRCSAIYWSEIRLQTITHLVFLAQAMKFILTLTYLFSDFTKNKNIEIGFPFRNMRLDSIKFYALDL